MADFESVGHVGNSLRRNGHDSRELRPVSILCCDIVDSTGLSRRLHTEDYQDLLVRFRETCAHLTEQAGGQVVVTVGDSVLACFGYPTAHDDDSDRALRTALDIVRDIKAMKAAHDAKLEVRVAVATGTVPTGNPDVLIDSATTNLVARLTKLAEPGSVVTDAKTHELSQLMFECTDAGIQALKGFEEPVQLWRVDRAYPFAVRFDAKARRGLAPFVNREQELSALLGRWEEAQRARGQVILLGGEPGIGKSRLAQVFRERIGISEPQLLRLQCLPDRRNTALHSIIDQLRRTLDLGPDEPVEGQLTKLERFIASWSKDVSRHMPVYAALLSLPQTHYGQIERNPEKLRTQTQAALLEYLAAVTDRAPFLLVVEDIHWADPTTTAVLGEVIGQARHLRLLLVATFRQGEFNVPWRGMDHVTTIKLEQLDDRHRQIFVENLAAGRELAPELCHSIVLRGGGVPLFLEELTKSILETGHAASVPGQLESLLHARLDHVGKTGVRDLEAARTVKEVAQVAAVIGWEFSLELLTEVLTSDAEPNGKVARAVEGAVERLVESELISRHGNTCRFSHMLIREEAYRSLLRRKRLELHARIAGVLKERGDHFGAPPELVASHCEAAGYVEDATYYWQQAGRREARRSSNQEAEHHFYRAIETSNALPQTVANLTRRLELHNDLGPVLMASHGFAAPVVEQVYERAVQLGAQIGRPIELYFPALAGLQLVRICQGRHREACQLGEELLSIAEEQGEAVYLIEAHRHRGAALFWMGEVVRSRADCEQVLALYAIGRDEEIKYVFGTDPKVSASVFLSMGASLIGRFGEAAARDREAIDLARASAHRHTQSYANLAVALSHDFRREPYEASEHARAAMHIGSEIPFWGSWARVIYGRTLLKERSSVHAGLDQITAGIEESRKIGSGIAETYFMLVLAEAHAASGNLEESLRWLEQGLVLTERGGERFCEPEMLRMKGDLLLRTGASDTDVERCFLTALAMSKRRGARLFELRAAVSLSQLWRGQTRRNDMRDRIAAILGAAGADIQGYDLADAKRALDSAG